MNKSKELMYILDNNLIYSVFQPIVSLNTGNIFAFEALSRIDFSESTINIEELFKLAEQENKLWELEKLCRKTALKQSSGLPRGSNLFVNVDPNIINDSKFKSGFTNEKLSKYKVNPDNIIFEITERSAIKDMKIFKKSIHHYQSEHFKIAVDDFGSGYSGLNRVCNLYPDFIKIDMALVRDIDKNIIKRSAVGAIANWCRQSKIMVIAEGIETKEELKVLSELGIDYGQGFYLGRPKKEFYDIDKSIKFKIECLVRNKTGIPLVDYIDKIMSISIENYYAKADEKVINALQRLNENKNISEFFVIDSKKNVKGIIKRVDLESECTSSLKKDKCLDVMKNEFLVADLNEKILDVAIKAMNRPAKDTYESIAITKDNKYMGMVTIQDIIIAIIKLNKLSIM